MCDLGGRDTQSVSRGGVVQKPKDYRHREQACNQQNRRKPHQPPQHDLAFAPKVVVDAFLVWHGWCFLASVAFGALTEGAAASLVCHFAAYPAITAAKSEGNWELRCTVLGRAGLRAVNTTLDASLLCRGRPAWSYVRTACGFA